MDGHLASTYPSPYCTVQYCSKVAALVRGAAMISCGAWAQPLVYLGLMRD